MMLDVNLLSKARASVVNLPLYDAGISIDMLRNTADMQKKIHNLSVNENPFGMSSHALEALQQAIKTGAIYPDSDSFYLRKKISEKLNIATDRIIAGNGSEDILAMICKVFISSGDRVLIPKPTFSLHNIYAAMMGAEIIEVPIDSSLNFNVSGWLETIEANENLKLLMLANPSNPVGCCLNHDELTELINACPKETLLIIDEAYVEYAVAEPGFPRVFEILEQQDRPWIVLRTFSKAYGLAGMRVGYGVCSNSTFVNLLNRVRTPYNVNRLAQIAAVHALEDQQHLEKTVQFTISERDKMRNEILSWGISVAPSSSNFLFIDTQRSSIDIANRLLQSNILIKAWKTEGYKSFIRISIGLEEQNRFFLKELKSIICNLT